MYKLLSIALCALFLISCNQDDNAGEIITPEQEDPSFFALQIGNTWEYQYFRYLTVSDSYENLGVLEKVDVTNTEIINGETYYNFKIETTGNDNCPVCYDNGTTNLKVRDSLGYLIREDGEILFSSENIEEYPIKQEPWGDIFGILESDIVDIEVEAGNFMSLYNRNYAINPNDGLEFPGNDELYYTSEVGLVYRKYDGVTVGDLLFEKRLLSFRQDE